MKILEIITESKTQTAQSPKPRNFVAKNAMKTTSGAGAHKNKKKAVNQGDVKHKKSLTYEDGEGGASAGSTTSAMVGVGAVYKNKRAKKQKPGTNALDMKGINLLTGGSIKR